MSNQSSEGDFFAQVATQRLARRSKALVEPQPIAVPDRALPLSKGAPPKVRRSWNTISTARELTVELDRYRRRFKKFLNVLAPPLADCRISRSMARFDWREETAADRHDFASHTVRGKGKWTSLSIPHYGPPLGPAVTYYRAPFRVTKTMLARGSVWVVAEGIDYKAHVYVNGYLLGSHEGFFAPFEFDATAHVHPGVNSLLIQVENDAPTVGHQIPPSGLRVDGDKIYACTGPGYDDPDLGWHHGPPGMGIYQPLRIEARARHFLRDLFVRPLPDAQYAEVWVEVFQTGIEPTAVELSLSVFGQNFRKTVCRDKVFRPTTCPVRGHGDVDKSQQSVIDQPLGPGVNYFRIPVEMPEARLWELDEPWLYQCQVQLLVKGRVVDAAQTQFGMRSFRQDENSSPRGKFMLNGKEVRLRGANTMGHLQQSVLRGDKEQLIDDILLAKICHMNFLRLTQRPVQRPIYDLCDRLGLMTQTDLPLFGKLRRNQSIEALRQTEEMERLIRPHASAVLVSFINEPFPNADGQPHRHLVRDELEVFFDMAAKVVRQTNPDRVIKCCDGDYDPPAPLGMPDNHCYCGWYLGHGLDLGKLHRGHWLGVEEGWHYGCGEFGAEGLDHRNVMEQYYPAEWLPKGAEGDDVWDPQSIRLAQTYDFHHLWYDTPRGMDDWIDKSQEFQAWIVRLMTEALRRDGRMNSFAIHLFIDAWPAGWMKTIMDVARQPKQAYFAYRDALTPLMVSLRGDRFAFRSGETIAMEAWVCNDTQEVPRRAELRYHLETGSTTLQWGKTVAKVPRCDSRPQGVISFRAPQVPARTEAVACLALVDDRGEVIHENRQTLQLFPAESPTPVPRAHRIARPSGPAARLARALGMRRVSLNKIRAGDVLLIDSPDQYRRHETAVRRAVRAGANALFLELPPGEYRIGGDLIQVRSGGMGKRHFVSRDSAHPMVAGFLPNDFRFWHDDQVGYVTPLLETVLESLPTGWSEILKSGDGSWHQPWHAVPVAIEKREGEGVFRICQMKLACRVKSNPPAEQFARRLLRPAGPQ